jgi:hypothetical protein
LGFLHVAKGGLNRDLAEIVLEREDERDMGLFEFLSNLKGKVRRHLNGKLARAWSQRTRWKNEVDLEAFTWRQEDKVLEGRHSVVAVVIHAEVAGLATVIPGVVMGGNVEAAFGDIGHEEGKPNRSV